MSTAIIFNLDYENQPLVKCRRLWTAIEMRMIAAGFTKVGRIFVSVDGSETAFARAQKVLAGLERDYRTTGDSAANYLRDFYGMPYSDIVNLKASAATPAQSDVLAPRFSASGVEVDMMSTGAFQQFFS